MPETTQTQKPLAPTAEKRPLRSLHHGIERFDDYAWLRAENWQEVMRDPAVLAEDIRTWFRQWR